MKMHIDAAYRSLNKYGEELCGDKVQIIRREDSTIAVLADGLGSGVKANILSTLTSTILATMLNEGATVTQAVETLASTLPVCNIRKLAYSTFSVAQIFDDGQVDLVEFDNPPCMFVRNGKLVDLEPYSELKECAGKNVVESHFTIMPGDVITLVSDGVIYAGVGQALNFGWNWDNVSAELEKTTGHALCPGHGGSTTYLFATAPGQIPQAMHGQPGSSYFQELLPEETRGDAFFPVKYGDLTEEETGFTLTGNVFWNFADAEGNVLCPDEEFDQVGWFSGEALAPVQKDGKWAYVDAEGNFATEFVYESCWGSNYFYNPDTEEYELEEPCYTYSLWDGFAPVVRDGQWGVLDETGKEIIPCQYEAGAPYPGGAFLKKDGVWGLYLLED